MTIYTSSNPLDRKANFRILCTSHFVNMSTKKKQSVVDESKLGVTSIFNRTGGHAVLDHEADKDEEVLVALGYKQEFKRDLSIWSSFSVSFSVLGLLPSIASTLGYNLGYSGPAGMVWGWITAGILIQFVALSMAELCSSMPTAGGLYYASAVLAPEGWGPLCSWITGWYVGSFIPYSHVLGGRLIIFYYTFSMSWAAAIHLLPLFKHVLRFPFCTSPVSAENFCYVLTPLFGIHKLTEYA